MKNLPYNDTHINHWYISYQPQLVQAGLRFGLGTEEIKDIIHQFFLDLLEKKIDAHSIENPQAYISKSFKRRLIAHSRLCERKSHCDNSTQVRDSEPSIAETMEFIEQQIELKIKISRAYDRLPERCKKVIYLRYYLGHTTEQIVEGTGLSKRTIYNNLFEAIKLLRTEFIIKPPSFLHFVITTFTVYFTDQFL